MYYAVHTIRNTQYVVAVVVAVAVAVAVAVVSCTAVAWFSISTAV